MNWLEIGSRVAGFVLQYPFERSIKPDHSKSDQLRVGLLQSSVVIPQDSPMLEPPIQEDIELDDIIRREQEGDYCISCVPSKHLMRSKDALQDAMNIAESKEEFTDVAEGKLQQAVYELNAAEKDLEMAKIPEVVRPAADELHTQIRKLRNFLRQDQSGLEVATILPERFNDLKSSLETAFNVNEALIGFGYDIAKVQLRVRKEEMEANND